MDDLKSRKATRRIAWIGAVAYSLIAAIHMWFDADRVGRLLGFGQLLFTVIFFGLSWLAIKLSKRRWD